MRRTAARPARRGALLTALALLVLASAARAAAPEETVAGALELGGRFAALLRDSVAILDRRPDPETIQAAVGDARRAVAEIDRLTANAAIFQAAPQDRQKLQDMAAAAHLNLALFETHGLEFDRARQEIGRARALSDLVQSDSFRTEWAALPAGEPGKALQTRYNLLTLSEFEAALGSIWSRARPVPFEFRGITAEELGQVRLTPATTPPSGSLDERLLLQGTAQLRAAVDKARPSFTVSLPPGVYRLQGRPSGEIDRTFVVPEATDVDTVLVDRARFALRLDAKSGGHPPRFFLNGFEVTDLAKMPYGVYRLKADPVDYPTAPQVVRFVLGEGIPDKTRTSWTVYVPAGTPATLSFDRGTAPKRRGGLPG
ncbi:MAG TPA: hypothetical protein VFQ07_09200 [Candidatus Polarisedimenticolia bacterium]|nr:hypothetical protein [Candidatus Polarisedimenticolia bacterium]